MLYAEIAATEIKKSIMRKCSFLIALLTVVSFSLSAQTKITAEEAAKHIGDSVTVCAKIFGGRYFEKKVTLLNVGAAFPNSPLTIVIEDVSRGNFSQKPEEFYVNKEVCVTGVVKDYKGKPQIVISKEAEIVIKK